MHRRTCLGSLLASTSLVLPHWVEAKSDRLRIGLTPVILADQVAFLTRWGHYLSDRVGADIEFVARDSYQTILELLFTGQIDAAWICGYPYVRHESELNLLAVPLYKGQPSYQAYLICSKGQTQTIQSWADLRNRVLAFSDPLSNSGWLVAQAQLRKAGLSSKDLKKVFFTHGHRNVAEAVSARLAHAGAIDGYVWETMRTQGLHAAMNTEVVWKSEPFGFPPLVTYGRNEHAKAPVLRQALIDMSNDQPGKELLASLNLSGFAPGSPLMFESIKRQAIQVPESGVVA